MSSALTALSATDLARALRSGACSAAEAVTAYLDRIDRLNPRLNAVITLAAARARREAALADRMRAAGRPLGPLHGLPITIKDGFATAGLRTTFGLPAYGTQPLVRYRPDADAPAVAALRRAGAIVLGKTNLPLASYDWQTAHPWLGRTNNPHDLTRTPGGSSGGGAAAVGARLTTLDLGSDACGSLRVPAHFCGVFAMRPTAGRVPMAGMLPPGHPGLAHTLTAGPLARTAADLQLALRVLDPSLVAAPERPLRGLRVAVSDTLGDAPIGADIRAALSAFAAGLAEEGARVEEASPLLDFDAALRTWGDVHGYEFARGAPGFLSREPARPLVQMVFRKRYGPGLWPRVLADGFSGSPAQYADGLRRLRALQASTAAFFDQHDVWLHPIAGVTAFTHRRTGASLSVDGRPVPYSEPLGNLNAVTALLGTPCVALPVGTDRHGLPIGLQLHARRGADAALLAVARQLERAGLARAVAPPGYGT